MADGWTRKRALISWVWESFKDSQKQALRIGLQIVDLVEVTCSEEGIVWFSCLALAGTIGFGLK
eukprot:3266951-Amphidinium_carterae.1